MYWIGVHVLGASQSTGRDTIADGRARTFIPQVPRSTPSTRLALVVPVKAEVRRGAAGRLLGFGAWSRALGAGRPARPAAEPVRPGHRPDHLGGGPRRPRRRPLGVGGQPQDRPGPGRVERRARAGRRPRRRPPRPSPSDGAADGRHRRRRRGLRLRAVRPGGRGPRLAGGVPPAGADPHRHDRAVRRPRRRRGARHPARRALPAGPRPERGDDDRPRGRTAPASWTRSTAGCPAKALRAVDQDTPVLLRDDAFPGRSATGAHPRRPRARRTHRHRPPGPAARGRTPATPRSRCASGCSPSPPCTPSPPTRPAAGRVHAGVLGPGQHLERRRLLRRAGPAVAAAGRPAEHRVRGRQGAGRRHLGRGHAGLHPRRPQGPAAAREPAGHRAARARPGRRSTGCSPTTTPSTTSSPASACSSSSQNVARRPRPDAQPGRTAPPTTCARRCRRSASRARRS